MILKIQSKQIFCIAIPQEPINFLLTNLFLLSKYCDRVAFRIRLSIRLKREQWDCLVYEVLSSSVGVFSFHFFGTWIVCDQSSGHGAFFDLWAIRAPIPLVCYLSIAIRECLPHLLDSSTSLLMNLIVIVNRKESLVII